MTTLRLATILLLAASCGPAATQDPLDYDEIFRTDQIVQWEIQVAYDDWLSLTVDASSRPMTDGELGPYCSSDSDCPEDARCEGGVCAVHYVPATVTVGDREYKQVGLRVVGDRHGDKHNLRIRFEKYQDNQRFHGVERIDLRKNAGDPTVVREVVALALMRRAGVPAPRASLVTVSINGEASGVFTLVESVDELFLEDRFGSSDGNLYQLKRGSTLVYEGDDPAAYQPAFDRRYERENHKRSNDGSDLIELMQLLNSSDLDTVATQLPQALAVPEFITALAVNTWLANLHSYAGTADNGYLYRDTSGRFHYIPWGMHRSFGNYRGPSCDLGTDQLVELDPVAPTCGGPRPLVTQLLAVDNFYDSYLSRLAELRANQLAPAAVLAEIDSWQTELAKLEDASRHSGFTAAEHTAAFTKDFPEGDNPRRIVGLENFVRARAEYLNQ